MLSPTLLSHLHRYGYGFGALERTVYDPKEQLFYGGSELGFITISDFSAYPNVSVVDFGIPLEDTLTDLAICDDMLFVSTEESDLVPGKLSVYSTAQRAADGIFVQPTLIHTIEVGNGPDNVIVSEDCMIAVTANEGEGEYDEEIGLINPEGSVSIIRGPFNDTSVTPQVTSVPLNKWTEEELIEKGVHLPLSLNAMIYWNDPEGGTNFSAAIGSYTPASVLEPEYLQWSGDESKIYVNLQENNAMIIVDIATNEAESIHA